MQNSSVGKTRYHREIANNSYRDRGIAKFVASGPCSGEGVYGIVFVRMKVHAQALAEVLSDVLCQDVPYVTSDLAKAKRVSLAESVRSGDGPNVVVATSVWATGIDIPRVSWILWAGGGSAPIVLKQACGRATRRCEDKDGFVIYDWQDVDGGVSTVEEHNSKRMGFYKELGLTDSPVVVEADVEESEDVNRLRRLYDGDSDSASASDACDIFDIEIPDAVDWKPDYVDYGDGANTAVARQYPLWLWIVTFGAGILLLINILSIISHN